MNFSLISVFVIFLCLFAGKLISTYLTPTVPGSIWGMVILTLLLEFKVLKKSLVEPFGNFLLKNMALFFVPPGVGIVLYFDLIGKEFVPVIVSACVSTLIVMAVTGHVFQFMTRKED